MPSARLPSAQCVFPAAFWDGFQRYGAQQCQNCGAETGLLLPVLLPGSALYPLLLQIFKDAAIQWRGNGGGEKKLLLPIFPSVQRASPTAFVVDFQRCGDAARPKLRRRNGVPAIPLLLPVVLSLLLLRIFKDMAAQQCRNCAVEKELPQSVASFPVVLFTRYFLKFFKIRRCRKDAAEESSCRPSPPARRAFLAPLLQIFKDAPLAPHSSGPSPGALPKASAGSNPQDHKGLKTPPAPLPLRAARHSFRFAFSSPSVRALFSRCGRSGFPVLAKFSKKP